MSDMRLPYRDRRQAGRLLADLLEPWRGRDNLLVLALPRGGVPVGFEVAHALQAPLDVFVVRKLGLPGREEFAMGAIASGGVRVMNPLRGGGVTPEDMAGVVAREELELLRREQLYRDRRPAIPIAGRDVLIVDDGLATGSTMRAAITAVRQQHPLRIAVAVPVGADDTCRQLGREVDEVICAATPRPFRAVGLWYDDFPQTSDEEVRELLEEARREHSMDVH